MECEGEESKEDDSLLCYANAMLCYAKLCYASAILCYAMLMLMLLSVWMTFIKEWRKPSCQLYMSRGALF